MHDQGRTVRRADRGIIPAVFGERVELGGRVAGKVGVGPGAVAGAVLMAAFLSLIVGSIIFGPHLYSLIK